MKHVDFKLSYNDIMCEELEYIENFLIKQFDLRYGQQAGEWILNPMPELVGAYGTLFKVREIRLVKKCFVKFILKDGDEFEAHNFAYGELSKIIDALPEFDTVRAECMDGDLRSICSNYNVKALLREYPYEFTERGDEYKVLDVFSDSNEIAFEIEETHGGRTSSGIWNVLDSTKKESLVSRLKRAIMRESKQYKELKKLLSYYDRSSYNFEDDNSVGMCQISPYGSDLKLPVLDVSVEGGELKIIVSVAGTRLEEQLEYDYYELLEHEIEPEELSDLVDYLGKNMTIMDTHNGHDPALVGSINAAWNDKKCHDKFQPIIYAMFMKYIKEFEEKVTDDITDADYDFPMNYLYEILMRLCDDKDLEIILDFVEYDKK